MVAILSCDLMQNAWIMELSTRKNKESTLMEGGFDKVGGGVSYNKKLIHYQTVYLLMHAIKREK